MPTPLRSSSHRIAFTFCFMLLISSAALGGVNGAIFTTTSTGTTVNGNIYFDKSQVYLNGGPQNSKDPGLVPDGTYYFQVTDPSGAVLLSLDDISCRQVVVSGGRITGVPTTPPPAACVDGYHTLGTFNAANGEQPIQLCNPNPGKCETDFANTPNPGGEYKAWLTPVPQYVAPAGTCSTGNNVFGFCDSQSKTDNFKVEAPTQAFITVCKFQACSLYDDDGTCGGTTTDPLLSGWQINATGADQTSAVTTSGFGQATPFGCATFSVSNFTNGSATVGLNEIIQTGWIQAAPDSNTPGATSGAACAANGSVPDPTGQAGETCTVSPGQSIAAANFGNVQIEQGTPPTLVKTANGSYNTTYTWQIQKTVANPTLYTAGGAPATFNYTVTVTHDGGTVSNVKVAGDITITNPNQFPITIDTVTDTLSDSTVCSVTGGTAVTVPASSATVTGSVDLPYSCSESALPALDSKGMSTLTNSVTISWSDQSGTTTNGVPWTLSGGTAPYTSGMIFFANGVIDGSVNVTDTLGGTLGTVSSTDPSPTIFTYSETFNDPAGTCTTHPNTATFTTNTTGTTGSASQSVQDCQGANLTVRKTATATYNSNIIKSVDKTRVNTYSGGTATFNYTVNVTTSGWTVTGNITVTNPNNWEAVAVNLADALTDAGGLCSIAGGNQQIVPASGSISPAYTCSFAVAPTYSSGSNTATVTWNAATASTTLGQAQWTANYAFNPLTVTDTFNGTTTTLGAVTIPPGSATFTYAHTVPAPSGACATYNNTAQITGGSSSNVVSVMVCGASDLTVTKTAAGAFNSGISKSVNQTTVQQSGGNITFNYTVTATESAWTVSGNISVSNPNNWEPITAAVTDALTDLGGACTVNGGSNVVAVAASSTSVLPYICTFAARPSLINGTNTATATWSSAAAYTKDSSASYMAGYSFNTLTITDNVQSSTYPGGCNATLGTLSVTTTTPSASPGCGVASLATSKWGVFTYSITDANSSPGTCSSYNNTAQIAGGSSSNRVTVTACNTNTGALTMGFWKNTNGQKIIKAGSSTGGVCNLATYLRGYNSFDDLSATASCSAAASYVGSTIGAATCGGSTCNPMLKAQMLATALDVFFSTPGLGGNQIGAYNGLGAKTPPLVTVAINLSNLCDMIDGTSSSTCSGSYEDVRPEFGINGAPPASCQAATVSTMLAYSDYLSAINGSPVSNTGGTTWYKQIKNPNQVYAKDGFDNVNNDIAPIATGTVCTSSF